jgi:hypothetical protein
MWQDTRFEHFIYIIFPNSTTLVTLFTPALHIHGVAGKCVANLAKYY